MSATSPSEPPHPRQPSKQDRTRERSDGRSSQFLVALGHRVESDGLDPSDLSCAAADALGVDGAGIALLFNELRIPLGASNRHARHAEQAQTTLGTGPCLDAAETRTPVVADQALLESDYPLYAEALTQTTPFRAVAALPLYTPGGGVIAALDLFSIHPDLSRRLDTRHAARLARLVGALLTACLDDIHDIDTPEAGPDWYQQATRQRHDVWLAVGMVMSDHTSRARDALDLLRAHAYCHNTTLDDLAADLINGRITIDQLGT